MSDKPVKVFEVSMSIFYPGQRASPLEMPPGRYVREADFLRVAEIARDAWEEGNRSGMYVSSNPTCFENSETAALLRAMEGGDA
jgi:hypothetical protein